MSKRPLIGITACRQIIEPHYFHVVGEKYIDAVVDGAEGVPLPLPALAERLPLAELLDCLDGLLVTGSPSNVEPHHYGGEPSKPGTRHDPHRDLTTLRLIPAAVAAGVPVFAICRGFQEMNVAFGGSLLQAVHEQPDRRHHHPDEALPIAEQYGPMHTVQFAGGGLLERVTGTSAASVNSLHYQGVDRLANGLAVEARADDGLIEAFRVENASAFALAVQWHPEWRVMENPVSLAIFRAFGEACRERARES